MGCCGSADVLAEELLPTSVNSHLSKSSGYFFMKYFAPNHPKKDEDSPGIWDDWITNGQLIDRLNQWLSKEEQARLQAPIALIAFDLDPEPGPYTANSPLQDQIAALFSSLRRN